MNTVTSSFQGMVPFLPGFVLYIIRVVGSCNIAAPSECSSPTRHISMGATL